MRFSKYYVAVILFTMSVCVCFPVRVLIARARARPGEIGRESTVKNDARTFFTLETPS